MAQTRRAGFSKPASGVVGVDAMTRNPERRSDDRISVVHPHGLFGLEAGKELGVEGQPRDRAAVLAALVGDLSPGGLREPLHSVAEAENGDAEARRVPRGLRRVRLVHALRPARQDDAGGVPAPDLLRRSAGREDDREDPRVADTPGDQLRVLAAEVEDDDRPGSAHAGLTFERSATGPARAAAGAMASAAPAKGAAAAIRGATRAPGACLSAARSAIHMTTALPTRKKAG